MADRAPLFAQGIARPVAPNGSGALRAIQGDAYLSQIVEIMVSECESDNPFQQGLGVGADAVFAVDDDPSWKAVIRRKLEAEFKKLANANLAVFGSLIFQTQVSGEYTAIVKFRSIETNTDLEVSTTIRST